MTPWLTLHSDEVSACPDERGLQYGDGLFETIALRDGDLRLWDHHMERLACGAARLGLRVPAASQLREFAQRVITASPENRRDGILKLIVTAGRSGRGYGRSLEQEASVYGRLFARTPLGAAAYTDGVEIMLCETRLASGSPFAGLKTLNRLEQVVARSECEREGRLEGLTLDVEGRLICGTMSNVFIVKDRQLITPLLERSGVAGVMRRRVLEVCAATGEAPIQVDLRLADLESADEVFLTNSQFGVVPVRRCGDQRWAPGPITRTIMVRLAADGIVEQGA